jgi:two-component system, LuxR family, sensor kinase FixL
VSASRNKENSNTTGSSSGTFYRAQTPTVVDGFVVTDSQGTLLIYSDACEERFGYRQDEVIGRSVKMLMPASHRGEHDNYQFCDAEPGTNGLVSSGETVGWHKDHSTFPIHVSVGEGKLLGRRNYIVVIRDLTDGRHSNDQIKQQDASLRSILEAAPYAIFTTDGGGLITTFNPMASRLFGYAPDEAIGHDVRMLMPQTYRGQQDGYRLAVGHHRDGSTFPMELTVVGLHNGNKALFSSHVRGSGERCDTEQRLHELQAELLHVSRLNAMVQMSAAIAHELTDPLAAIMNYVKAAGLVMQASDQTAKMRAIQFMDRISTQVLHADSILQALRSFTDRRDYTRTLEPLNSVVEEAIAVGFVGLAHPGIKIHLDLAPALPRVLIDRIQIQQVLVNLIHNSMEAMQKADTQELFVSTGIDEPGFVQVTIRDTGPGLSEDARTCLFQPFITTKDNGMGIGLTICQSIIDAHGGHIWALPDMSPGATFRFRLPLASHRETSP